MPKTSLYDRQQRAKEDKDQMMFCPGVDGGLKKNPNVVKIVHDTSLDLMMKVSCPHCLGLSTFMKFLVSTKQGISDKNGQCPLCGDGMRLSSLKMMSTNDPAAYARFVFNYHGFWKLPHFNFTQWKNRLKLMGWTDPFWKEYHRIKDQYRGERQENYMDYLERKQLEEAQEQGLLAPDQEAN
jgi:hypothetical protein